jgi:hypothetical protein
MAISIPEERWLFATESLPTLRGLADWVRSTPMVVRGRKRVLADLERMEQILERAAGAAKSAAPLNSSSASLAPLRTALPDYGNAV